MRLRSLHSDWMANQEARVVKGNLAWPWRMGRVNKGENLAGNILARGALRLAKSDSSIAAPDTCLTEAWK